LLNTTDRENLLKASHSAEFLVQELTSLTKAQDPLLADISIEVLSQAVAIKDRLNRLVTLTTSIEQSA